MYSSHCIYYTLLYLKKHVLFDVNYCICFYTLKPRYEFQFHFAVLSRQNERRKTQVLFNIGPTTEVFYVPCFFSFENGIIVSIHNSSSWTICIFIIKWIKDFCPSKLFFLIFGSMIDITKNPDLYFFFFIKNNIKKKNIYIK